MSARLASIYGEISALFAEACRELGGNPSLAHNATDRELDSPRGNPQVTGYAPRSWTGGSCAGKKYSDCPSEFLLLLAEQLEWSAANPKPDKAKYAGYDRQKARLARGWAARIDARANGVDDRDESTPNGSSAPARNGAAPAGDAFGDESNDSRSPADNPFETGSDAGPPDSGPSNSNGSDSKQWWE